MGSGMLLGHELLHELLKTAAGGRRGPPLAQLDDAPRLQGEEVARLSIFFSFRVVSDFTRGFCHGQSCSGAGTERQGAG